MGLFIQSCDNYSAFEESLEDNLIDNSIPRLKSGSESGGSTNYNYTTTTYFSSDVKLVSHRYTTTISGNFTWKLLSTDGMNYEQELCSAAQSWSVTVALVEDNYYVKNSNEQWNTIDYIKYINGVAHTSPSITATLVDTYKGVNPKTYKYEDYFTVNLTDKQARIKCSALAPHPFFNCNIDWRIRTEISSPNDFYIHKN
jgi:hypothetical protein